MAREVFAYWRVEAAQAASAEAATLRMQAQLRASHPGLQTRLYRRTDTEGTSCTLMETYARGDIGIDAALRVAVDAAAAGALAAWCSARQVEVFDEVRP